MPSIPKGLLMVHLISFFFFVPSLSLLDCIKSNLSHHYLLPSMCLKDMRINQTVVAHTSVPALRRQKQANPLSSRPVLFTERVPRQPR